MLFAHQICLIKKIIYFTNTEPRKNNAISHSAFASKKACFHPLLQLARLRLGACPHSFTGSCPSCCSWGGWVRCEGEAGRWRSRRLFLWPALKGEVTTRAASSWSDIETKTKAVKIVFFKSWSFNNSSFHVWLDIIMSKYWDLLKKQIFRKSMDEREESSSSEK